MFTEPTLGNITAFAGTFAPRSWALCQGQLFSIAEYTTLYAIIGTTFGGDGVNTFGMPNFSGRQAIHTGQGSGFNNYILGQAGGNENIVFSAQHLPSHTHTLISVSGNPAATSAQGNTNDPNGNIPATIPNNSAYSSAPTGTVLGESSGTTNTPPAGASSPVNVLSPYLVMNYLICIEGLFPSRN